MKKNFLLKLVYILAGITVLFNTFFSIKNYLVADVNNLPKGTLQSTAVSPSGNIKLNVYRVSNSLGDAIRAELVKKGGKPKTIFWQTGIDNVFVTWTDEDVIFINQTPLPSSGNFVYDCRKGTSLFTDGALVEDFLRER